MCFMSTADFDSVIRGHHIYKAVWHPIVGEILAVCIERGNVHDRHAVCVQRGSVTARSVMFHDVSDQQVRYSDSS